MSEHRPVRHRDIARRTALLGAAVLMASGCGRRASALPPDRAVAHYDAVAEELLAALVTVRPLAWERSSERYVDPGTESCQYQPGSWTADGALYPEPGQGIDWEPWRAALDPVLESNGFEVLGREQNSGGAYWLESEDEHGALLELHADGKLVLMNAQVDAEPCEDAALGL